MDPMIWVVDDDNSIRFVFEKALTVNHIHFRIFESGDAALEALKEEHPDVIISDIRMPGTDGLHLIKEVHKIDNNIPVIIMTAHSDLTAAIDSYESGTFEYLPKPFDVDQAIAVIRRAAVHRVNMLRLAEEKNNQQHFKALKCVNGVGNFGGHNDTIPSMKDMLRIPNSDAASSVEDCDHGIAGRIMCADFFVLVKGEQRYVVVLVLR